MATGSTVGFHLQRDAFLAMSQHGTFISYSSNSSCILGNFGRY